MYSPKNLVVDKSHDSKGLFNDPEALRMFDASLKDCVRLIHICSEHPAGTSAYVSCGTAILGNDAQYRTPKA